MPGKLREGENVRYRIRVADNRRLSEPELKPHEIVYPESGWATVGVNPTAPPIEIQEIEGERDAVQQGLKLALEENEALTEDTRSLLKETRSRFELQHQILLEKIRDRHRQLAGSLQDLVRNTSLTHELRPLAAAINEVASRYSKDAETLRNSFTNDSKTRSNNLTATIYNLEAAKVQLDELMERNLRITQARIDCHKIESLIAAQLALAARVKLDTKTSPAEMATLQKELSARLAKMIADSEPLRLARDESKKKEVQNFTMRISDLAAMLLDLDSSIKQLEMDIRKGLLEKLAADDEKVAKNAAAMLKKLDVAARLCGLNAPDPEEFARVVSLIVDGKTVEALTEFQRLAGALEALTASFEKWTIDRADPKFASRQFAKWQEDLHTRFKMATNGNESNFNTLPLAARNAYQREQTAIRGAFSGLALPPSRDLDLARQEALAAIEKAEKCLASTGAGADEAMKAAVNSLNRISDKTHSIAERKAKSRSEFEDIQKEQVQIFNSVQLLIGKQDMSVPGAIQSLTKKLETSIQRQHKQLGAFKALDLPGMNVRRTRILIALGAATADLEGCLHADIIASQTWANREFERLKQALDRSSSADEKVVELTAHLEIIAAAIETMGMNPGKDQLNSHSNAIQGILKDLSQLTIPEVPSLKNDAATAIQSAETCFHDGAKHEDRRKQIKLAIASMRKLSDRLQGGESELERVQRLSWNRRLAAIKAQGLIGKENRPESDEAQRQLRPRKSVELLCTRVGMAGQFIKLKALESI